MISLLRVVAKALDNNKNVEFFKVTSIELSATLESPTVNVRVGMFSDKLPPKLGEIEVWIADKKQFNGKIDLQKTSINQNGIEVYIEARTKGALVLDNEAKPETLWGANLATIFIRHVSKFGFSLVNEMEPKTMAVFTIRKGMSHWDVFCEFAKRLYGIKPFVVGEQIYIKDIKGTSPRLIFNNSDIKAMNYTKFEQILTPYHMISKIYLRDERGEYSASVENSVAGYYGVERQRYVIAPSELLSIPQIDANARIKASISNAELYRLETNNILSVNLGDTVEIAGSGFSKKSLVIVGFKTGADNKDEYSVLELKEVGKV